VNAAATAVFWTSTACMVGEAGVPHALMIMAMTTAVRIRKCFMLFEYLLVNLAIGVTTAHSGNAVIFDNNFPIAFCDTEPTECFEILFAGDKCSGSVLPNWPGETVTGDDQVSALTHGCHHIHGQNDRSLRLGLVCDREIRGWSLPSSKGLIANVLIVTLIARGGGSGLWHRGKCWYASYCCSLGAAERGQGRGSICERDWTWSFGGWDRSGGWLGGLSLSHHGKSPCLRSMLHIDRVCGWRGLRSARAHKQNQYNANDGYISFH
jgi:hypothetical protein